MPSWLLRELRKGAPIRHVDTIGNDGRLVRESYIENQVSGLVPLLAQLSAMDRSVESAYFCHPSVQHCFKRERHSGFCGYHNIQTQMSYIQGARAQGHERLGDKIPGVLKIQDMIENAWDKGFHSLGYQQTGGVKNTRKWIGTPEVRSRRALR